jgi:hypothetical protein
VLEANADSINATIHEYEPGKNLVALEGMRKTLPLDAFPALEIEPTSASNEWATTRAQRPRYNFNCTLTVVNNNEQFGVEYISAVTTAIVEVLTDPQNLQLRIMNETRWDPNLGIASTYLLDSLVENVTYNANKDGTIRTAEFDLFALIHEPFPDSHFWIFFSNAPEPTEVRPRTVTIP